MRKISDALSEIVAGSSFIQFGLQHRLINLSQLARFLAPLVAARTKKEIAISALHMSLSRLQNSRPARERRAHEQAIRLDHLSIQPELAILTAEKTRLAQREAANLYSSVQHAGGHVTISEGRGEVTAIFSREHYVAAQRTLKSRVLFKSDQIAAISARFNARYLRTPGFLFTVLQSLYLQNINIVEISSTSTEIIFYLAESDIPLAFDTLFNRFCARVTR